MGWGNLLGAAAGFALGGPAGMALGSSLGGAVEETTGGGATGAARQAAATANAAAERDLALRRQMYEEGVARQKPFYEAGVNALPGYVSGIAPGGELVRGFTQADYQADPGYAFRLSEGQKGLDRQAAARGGLISGGALKAAQRYGQEMGSQEYQNAYNRFINQQTTRRNALGGLAGYGPSAANAMTTAGTNYATGAGANILGQGETSANALLAAQQSRGSSYGQLGSVLGKYLGGNTSFGGGSSGTFTDIGGLGAASEQYTMR